MAKKTGSIDIKIGNSAATDLNNLTDGVKSLKTQVKEAQQEAQLLAAKFGETSKEALAAQKKFAGLKDELSDFNQRVASLDPGNKFKAVGDSIQGIAGGFAAAQGAAALFGGESEDLQKTMIKLQAALGLSQGIDQIRGLGDAFGNLKLVAVDALNGIKKAFLTNPIFFAAAAAITALAAAFSFLALQETESQKQIRLHNQLIDKQIALNKQNASIIERRYDHEINLAKAAGKETFELEKLKLLTTQQRIAEEITLLAKKRDFERDAAKEEAERLLNSFGGAGKVIAEAQLLEIKKQETKRNREIIKLGGELQDSKNALAVLEITEETKKNEKLESNYKDFSKKKSDLDKAYRDEKAELDRISEKKQNDENLNAALKVFTGFKEIDRSIKTAIPQTIKEIQAETITSYEQLMGSLNVITNDFRGFQTSEAGKAIDESVKIASNAVSQLDTLFKLSTDNQLNAAKGNEKKQEEIRKKAFEREKALRLAGAILDTYKSTTNALATTPVPFNFIAAAAAAAFGFLQVGLISKQKYQSDATGSAIPTSGSAVNLPDFANQPTINSTGVNQQQTDQTGSNITTQVIITQGQLEENRRQEESLMSKVNIQ